MYLISLEPGDSVTWESPGTSEISVRLPTFIYLSVSANRLVNVSPSLPLWTHRRLNRDSDPTLQTLAQHLPTALRYHALCTESMLFLTLGQRRRRWPNVKDNIDSTNCVRWTKHSGINPRITGRLTRARTLWNELDRWSLPRLLRDPVGETKPTGVILQGLSISSTVVWYGTLLCSAMSKCSNCLLENYTVTACCLCIAYRRPTLNHHWVNASFLLGNVLLQCANNTR